MGLCVCVREEEEDNSLTIPFVHSLNFNIGHLNKEMVEQLHFGGFDPNAPTV